MKKLLVLMLVLGIASAANATLALSFDGQPNPGEVTITVSTNFKLDVHQDTAGVGDEFWFDWAGPASPTGSTVGVVGPAAPTGFVADDGGYGLGYVKGRMTEASLDGAIGEWWYIDMHCDGIGDVLVQLWNANGTTVIDTLTIHQVPEPMTISLLGLGGLLLRRRK